MRIYIEQNVCERRVIGYERLLLFMKKNDIDITRNKDKADFILFFACGMKTDNTKNYIAKVLESDTKLIVYGCAAKMLGLKQTEKLIPIHLYEYDKINEVFRAKIKYQDINIYKHKEKLLDKQYTFHNAIEFWDPRLIMPKCDDVYSITISEGCSNNCSYCAIHFATGELKSRKKEEIADEMKSAIASGYKYFRLQCENSGSYGTDIGSNLGELLDELSKIEEDYSIDIPDLHPQGLVENIDSILRFLSKKSVYLIHLPVQSGSQRILDAMNRKYNIDRVEECLHRLYKCFPEVHVGTDIIVGFPGEEDEDFQASFNFIRKFPFVPLYVHGYCDKEGTIANELENKVNDDIICERINLVYAEYDYAACYLNDYRSENVI